MITTTVKISSDGSETGALLQTYLADRGVYNARGPAVVCYGLSTVTRPALNASCQSDKITRMQRMQDAGIPLVPWTDSIAEAARMRFPLLARKTYGMGAKDLVPVFQAEELPWRQAAGWTWYSSYVPIEREMRFWTWRGEVLDGFEKVMQRPSEYRGVVGRNFGSGFEFRKATNEPAGRWAALAGAALGLDFAAIDLIIGKDSGTYILEANTAGGVIRSGAQATLAKLADRIADWARADCPDWRQ